MTDKEFIVYLCKQIWGSVTDGDEIYFPTIEQELKNRDINPDDLFTY